MHELAVGDSSVRELNDAVALGEERVITAHADQFAGMNTRAALPHQNFTRADELSGVALDTEHFGLAVAAVAS